MKYDIFVSYRRKGGGKEYARTLTSELTRLGYKVFLDFNELKDSKFGPQIIEAIDSASVFLFILSEGALDRCIEEGDWVRSEIMYALEKNKHIVPVNPDGAFKSFPEGIPEEITKALGDEQHSDIMFGQLFNKSVEKMVDERIEPYVQKSFFRRYRKAIISTLAAIAAAIVLMVALSYARTEKAIRQDIALKEHHMSMAKELSECEDSIALAYRHAFLADSIADSYDGTKHEKRFGKEAENLLSDVEARRDSVATTCSLKFRRYYDLFLRSKSHEDKAMAQEYLSRSLSAREDKDLRMWMDILKY